jgi:probable phosphomutase (TIGR03848 family)
VATLLLLRHGRTSSNASGTLAGRQPTELDETGRAQAGAVGVRLAAAALPLAAVVCSPLVRCRQTLTWALPKVEPSIEERLVECDYGDWEGESLKTLAKQPLWQTVQVHPSAAVFPNGEGMAAMAARAVTAVREWDARVAAEHGPDAIWLACSHGDVIKTIIADALGMHLDLFQRLAVDPGSLTVIRYTPLRPFVLRANDAGGDLSGLRPPKRRRRRAPSSDAPVGGGAGSVGGGGSADSDSAGPVGAAAPVAEGGDTGSAAPLHDGRADRIGSKA